LIISLGQLQKLARTNRPTTAVLNSMNLHELVSVLADWTNSTPVTLATKHSNNFIVAHEGRVSTTRYDKQNDWQVNLATYLAVWWLQNRLKPFEALTSAVCEYQNT